MIRWIEEIALSGGSEVANNSEFQLLQIILLILLSERKFLTHKMTVLLMVYVSKSCLKV